jgi:hypothetical protein
MEGLEHNSNALLALTAVISAATALVAAIIGPLVQIFVVRYQLRRSFNTNLREKWASDFRSAAAEYMSLAHRANQNSLLIESAKKAGLQADYDVHKSPKFRTRAKTGAQLRP